MTSIEAFGKLGNSPVYMITLDNSSGVRVQVLTLGGRVRSIIVPDKNAHPTDVCLGYEKLDAYIDDDVYLGAVLGRCANRIGGSCVTIDGKQWPLDANEGKNQLHGGSDSFSRRVWEIGGCDDCSVTLKLFSPHLDQGYPGSLNAAVTYSLSPQGRLEIYYEATSDMDTLVSLSNHTYFNLSGHDSGNVYDNVLTLNASRYTVNMSDNIPTGEIAGVGGTPLDFTSPISIGERIDDPMLAPTRGYDHNYVLDGDGMRTVAHLYSPRTGIALEAQTTTPGMQVYSAGFLTARTGKGGADYKPHQGVCLEAQCFPDAIHHPDFPSPLLLAGEIYSQRTAYTFTARVE